MERGLQHNVCKDLEGSGGKRPGLGGISNPLCKMEYPGRRS